MLSLSPRFDLFRFALPKDFLPEAVSEKYARILNENKSVITTPIDYLNESIQGITFPGISDLLVEQSQHSTNSNTGSSKINVEPTRKNVYYSASNPLSQVEGEFKVSFRRNQGLYNYFMMYETIFHKVTKSNAGELLDDVFHIYILNENGRIASRIEIFQPMMTGIEGLDFNYSKVERSNETFDVTFKFNNIDFDIVDDSTLSSMSGQVTEYTFPRQ